MDRKAYLTALDRALAELVPARERAEMIRYYEEYFDEAGPEGEADVIRSLGDPKVLAKKLAAEAGYEASPAPAVPKKRRRWIWGVLALVVGVVLLLVGVTILCVSILGVDFSRDPESYSTQWEGTDGPYQTGGVGGETEQSTSYGEVFSEIEIEVPVAEVTITSGDNYGIELVWDSGSRYSLSYVIDKGELKVTGSPKTVSGLNVSNASVTITIPHGVTLKEIEVSVGVGDIRVEQIAAADIYCSTGVGNVIWECDMSRDVELSTGVGDIDITIPGAAAEWEYELTTGLGQVEVDGEKQGRSARQSGASGELEVSTGTGDITLQFGA